MKKREAMGRKGKERKERHVELEEEEGNKKDEY